jgi:DNA-binding Lrp family transcriptional regulator
MIVINMQTTTNLPTYVFASINPGHVTQVVEELKRNNQIDFIAPVTGRYDLVLRLKPSTQEQVYAQVNQIRATANVRRTSTHTAFEGYTNGNKPESQMTFGISLLNVEHTPTANTLKQLSSTPGLLEAFSVAGNFDIVALWQAKTPQDIMTTANEKLASLPGLYKSETLITFAPFFRT